MSNGDDEEAAPPDENGGASTDAESESDGDTASEADADAEPQNGETEGSEEAGGVPSYDLDRETFGERLDEAAANLEAAETESDLDEVEATLDAIAADLEKADFPESDEGDGGDDEEDGEGGPRAELTERLEGLRAELEEKRGPYAEDAIATVEETQSAIREGEWTEAGEADLVEAVAAFLETVDEALEVRMDAGIDVDDANPEGLADALGRAIEAIRSADLDPDADAETIATLVEAATALQTAVEAAEEWEDLSVREQLQAQGFYDSLNEKHKDFPPEWSALKVWEQEGDVEKVLLALETFDSEFMERHAMEALERMGHPASLDAMLQRAQRRDKPAIRTIGNIGGAAEEAVETLHEFADGDPGLQKATLAALGRIGSTESTQVVADRLDQEEPEEVRSHAARALGLIGDPRAVKPLSETLAGDESDNVRASAAWALVQIGTEDALEAAAEHADDRSYIVQAEAEVADEALADEEGAAATA